jgi:signal transduction histidine kinase
MAEQGNTSGGRSGPGNKAIATTLLEWLSVAGRSAARDRAARVLEGADAQLATAPAWLADDAVAAMFTAGEVDVALARALGHRLISPDSTGLRLYGLGLATPEKAYRRVQALLPRDAVEAHWTVEKIEGRLARLRFEGTPGSDASGSKATRAEDSLCALRTGMLEAIPGLFGLLPAEVKETNCRAKGSAACRYEVRWQTSSRWGTPLGAGIGAIVFAALVWASFGLGAAPLLAASSIVVAGAAVGRVLDLQKQLEAVAGARRGHLALFDQVDDALAAKLDALARADAKLDAEGPVSPVRRVSGVANDAEVGLSPEDQSGILAAAQQIHGAAGDLECWFDDRSSREVAAANSSGCAGISDERGLVREIREWAARIGKLGSLNGEGSFARVDLSVLVGRAIATARPSLPASAVIHVCSDPELRSIECKPVQIEHLVVHLIQNAVEASVELSQAPEVFVTLANGAQGVELGVEDRGVGIDSAEIDEVFDPFFGDRPAGAGGLGLTVCLRIVEHHGGELRIENEDRAGTRVSVWLPPSAESGA